MENKASPSLRRRSSGLEIRRIGADLLVLDLETNLIHRLNETAGLIWANHDECRSDEALTRLLVDRFAVEWEIALDDVRSILEALKESKLLVPDEFLDSPKD